MKFLVDVTVRGEPKAQPRPRAFARNGKAHVYTPGTAEAWKGEIARMVGPREPYDGPVGVMLIFAMPRPKSHWAKGGVPKAGAPKLPTGKPDLDNLAKGVLDALTTMGVWRDDDQVVTLDATKRYDDGFGPGCDIRVWPVAEKGA